MKSRKFLLTLGSTIFFAVIISLALKYRPEQVVGLAGVMAGIITAYITANVVQDHIFNRGGKNGQVR